MIFLVENSKSSNSKRSSQNHRNKIIEITHRLAPKIDMSPSIDMSASTHFWFYSLENTRIFAKQAGITHLNYGIVSIGLLPRIFFHDCLESIDRFSLTIQNWRRYWISWIMETVIFRNVFPDEQRIAEGMGFAGEVWYHRNVFPDENSIQKPILDQLITNNWPTIASASVRIAW